MQRHYTWGDTVSLVESERVGGCAAIHARLLAKDPVHIHCAEECNRLEGKERGGRAEESTTEGEGRAEECTTEGRGRVEECN